MDENAMSLIDHLEEMRWRIIISVVAILVTTAGAFFLSNAILKLLLLPSGGLQLKAFSLMDGFMIKWQIALYAGITIAFPIWAYQIYRFVTPGLLAHERRVIFPALAGALMLFTLGAFFGYYLLWGMIRALLHLFPKEVELLPSADDYISFVIFFLLACGLSFQLPTVLIIFVQLGILSSATLRKQRRIAYFVLFAFAEIITPISDPIVAPLSVMAPLVILYEFSLWVSQKIEAKRRQQPQQLVASS